MVAILDSLFDDGQFVQVDIKVRLHPVLSRLGHLNCSTLTKHWISLVTLFLMDRHVEDSVARPEDVSNQMSFSSVASRLLDQVLEEVDSCDVSTRQKATD